MSTEFERKLSAVEKHILSGKPCTHDFLLIDPTEEQIADLDAEIDRCPNCKVPKFNQPRFICFNGPDSPQRPASVD